MEKHRANYPVTLLSEVLRVSRSGYYDWRGRPESHRSKCNRRLLGHIRRIHTQFRECLGSDKAWHQLRREGIGCGRHRVARLRREHNIYAKRRRRFVLTTRSKHRHWVSPNHLNQQFTTYRPNKAWVGDVTFIATRSGWLYLAVLLDLYSRKIVGWSMSNRNNGQLVLEALRMAIQHRVPPQGLIHHTDRGATYAMQAYREELTHHGMISSMSRTGNCYDNAVAESFFSNLKHELIYGTNFRTRDQARSAIFNYIEIFYNRQRIHQTLNYQTPVEFERMASVA